jgi:hypothetical protein
MSKREPQRRRAMRKSTGSTFSIAVGTEITLLQVFHFAATLKASQAPMATCAPIKNAQKNMNRSSQPSKAPPPSPIVNSFHRGSSSALGAGNGIDFFAYFDNGFARNPSSTVTASPAAICNIGIIAAPFELLKCRYAIKWRPLTYATSAKYRVWTEHGNAIRSTSSKRRQRAERGRFTNRNHESAALRCQRRRSGIWRKVVNKAKPSVSRTAPFVRMTLAPPPHVIHSPGAGCGGGCGCYSGAIPACRHGGSP